MLTFAIVFLSFNLFRITQNRLCFGYVFKHLIYLWAKTNEYFNFDYLLIENILELVDGSAVTDIYLIRPPGNAKVSD